MGLSVVINTNNMFLLHLFLQYGADPNVLMSSNCTELRSIARTTWKPIHMAVERLRFDCAKVLLDAGAEVCIFALLCHYIFEQYFKHYMNATPIPDLIQLLFQVDAVRVEKKSNFRRFVEQDAEETPLHIACRVCGCTGDTLWDPVSRKKGEQDDSMNAYAIVELLLERGANVNAIRRYIVSDQFIQVRETALHIAVKSKYPLRNFYPLLKTNNKSI